MISNTAIRWPTCNGFDIRLPIYEAQKKQIFLWIGYFHGSSHFTVEINWLVLRSFFWKISPRLFIVQKIQKNFEKFITNTKPIKELFYCLVSVSFAVLVPLEPKRVLCIRNSFCWNTLFSDTLTLKGPTGFDFGRSLNLLLQNNKVQTKRLFHKVISQQRFNRKGLLRRRSRKCVFCSEYRQVKNAKNAIKKDRPLFSDSNISRFTSLTFASRVE